MAKYELGDVVRITFHDPQSFTSWRSVTDADSGMIKPFTVETVGHFIKAPSKEYPWFVVAAQYAKSTDPEVADEIGDAIAIPKACVSNVEIIRKVKP